GLNPMGLAKNVVPFDISPSEIDSNKTHFEQIYERAARSLSNAIVVFNHAGSLANRLRQHQDNVTDFQINIEDQEANFNNRLIEVFGSPYPEDRDPLTGNVYGPNYNGPDLFHYDYIDLEDTLGLLPQEEKISVQFEVPSVITDTSALF